MKVNPARDPPVKLLKCADIILEQVIDDFEDYLTIEKDETHETWVQELREALRLVRSVRK